MAEQIGYQDGITAFFDWYRRQPGVPQRGPGYNPDDLSTWPWVDKMERTLRILKDDHDAAVVTNPPVEPPVEPPVGYIRVAPITVTQQGGSDQRVCLFTGEVEGGPLRPGVTKLPDGRYTDEHPDGAIYQSNGLEDTSVRTKLAEGAFGLVKAREMDSRNACQCPPSGDPSKNTGSWTV
jgi:hypothetical protein